MAKVLELEKGFWIYDCPACEQSHFFQTNGTPCWEFNSDTERPTVSPSVLVRGGERGNENVCHFFIKDGRIEYCGDSTHEFAGQNVEMTDLDN